MEITFKNLEISSRLVNVRAAYTEEIDLWFSFDRDVVVSSTQVALAMTTLCGTAFDTISFDFEVDGAAISTIKRITNAEVHGVPTAEGRPVTSQRGHLLSFSGGFDSLSARRIMPDDTHLVSLDFGGWFEREADFFRHFDTLVVETNVRSVPTRRTPLTRNHWSFLAIGAILTADYFNVKYHSFGQILGESLARAPRPSGTLPVLAEVGYTDAGYAKGLTEVGTTNIVLKTDLDRITDSLKSLAGPRDRKLFRKNAVSRVVGKELGIDANIPPTDTTKAPKIKFGDDYATSLAALYCISRGEPHMIEYLFESIPKDAWSLGKSLSMDFMQKINWDAYAGFPDTLVGGLWEKLHKFGFEPYSERDWEEVQAVRGLLSLAFTAAHD